MIGLGNLTRGLGLLQHTAVAQVSQLSDIFRSRSSVQNLTPPNLKIEFPNDEPNVILLHVEGVQNVSCKGNRAFEVFAKVTLVGEHKWYCEGTTKPQPMDPTTGNCVWNEDIEFSRANDYTDVKIQIGRNVRFGRFKVMASTRVRLSTIKKLTKPQWFSLYKDKDQKQKSGSIKLSAEFLSKESTVAEAAKVEKTQLSVADNSVCSDYLLKLVSDLKAQVAERDQRIKAMQDYIDQMLTRVLQHNPELLENK